jgi:hypothetical protein
MDSELYLALLENKDTWVDYFAELSLSSDNHINIPLDGWIYVVRSIYRTSDGAPILSININRGRRTTLLGGVGYFYSPTGELEDDVYTGYDIEELSDNIYCYT